ncbi:MAG: hypothetical protein L3K18_08300 [Thermoplasmata archaeon]|nr:hypothetical protein [Thermoplasmata archaeon]MCI4357120.1 hypothetical protein [Thermoplasmata archaeon]
MKPSTPWIVVAAALLLVVVGSAPTARGAVLTVLPVSESIREYEVGSDGANGYSAATLAVTTVPGGTTVCTTGTKNIPLTLGSANLVFSSSTGGTTCTAGDYAVELTLSFSATIATQTNAFHVTTASGGGAHGFNSEAVKLGVLGLPLPMVATVHIYVDYGSVSAPTGGIDLLDLAIV